MNDPNLAPTPSSITPSDIFYALFKHKVKIVLFAVLGIIAAGAVYVLYPKSYSSEARLFIRYVEQGKTPMQTGGNNTQVTTLETRSDSIINSELQIITSMDLAMKVAEKIGLRTHSRRCQQGLRSSGCCNGNSRRYPSEHPLQKYRHQG